MGSGGRLLAGRTEGGSFGEGFVDVMAEHRETLMTATHRMSEGRSTGERRWGKCISPHRCEWVRCCQIRQW